MMEETIEAAFEREEEVKPEEIASPTEDQDVVGFQDQTNPFQFLNSLYRQPKKVSHWKTC